MIYPIVSSKKGKNMFTIESIATGNILERSINLKDILDLITSADSVRTWLNKNNPNVDVNGMSIPFGDVMVSLNIYYGFWDKWNVYVEDYMKYQAERVLNEIEKICKIVGHHILVLVM